MKCLIYVEVSRTGILLTGRLAGGGLAAGTGALGQVHPGRCSRNPLPAGPGDGGEREVGGEGGETPRGEKR